ncbi:MAG: rhamnose ABC transporter substrate-binding protein [Herpetosiphonaceae bacterium]|nr:rhamnose ABC transporter substrate-binding protein [Herpetosiphonaceae bacterium]
MFEKGLRSFLILVVLAVLSACGGTPATTTSSTATQGAATSSSSTMAATTETSAATMVAATDTSTTTMTAATETSAATMAAATDTSTAATAAATDTSAATMTAATDTTTATMAAATDTSTATMAATGAAATAAGSGAAGGAKTYILVPKALGNPYFDTANKGAQQAAKELGVTVTYQGPATADATQQIQLINSLIAQNVSGLAISADDSDALVPAGKQAMDAKIPVVTWDSAIAPGGRMVHINQAVAADIAAIQIKMASDLAGGAGKIAILSATSTAPNQNEWIGLMKEELKKPDYAKLQLVDTVYGDDQDEKSYTEAQGLMKKYPDLKVIIAPTTVGIASSARAVQDAKLVGKVFVTGLGTPNQMRDYVKSGAAPQFALWNPSDLGYLAIQTLDAVASGKIKGQPGDTFTAGKLGSYTIDKDGVVLLGKPTVFNKDNIDQFNF